MIVSEVTLRNTLTHSPTLSNFLSLIIITFNNLHTYNINNQIVYYKNIKQPTNTTQAINININVTSNLSITLLFIDYILYYS